MNREMTLLATTGATHESMPTILFNKHAPALYKYAFRFHQSAMIADQVVGEIFAKFLEQASTGGYSGFNLRLELYAIAYDILVRDVRYRDYFMPIDAKIPKKVEPTDLGIEDQQLLKKIQHALLYDLTDDQRHVVVLRFVEGFSVKETALITGKKVGTVKVIQNRGIAALRKALDYGAVETNMIAIYIRQMSYA
jgi:RNA polymerase sigma-70 factor (ECF subfamily)